MIFYFSGNDWGTEEGCPEMVVRERANLMLSYEYSRKDIPPRRFTAIMKARGIYMPQNHDKVRETKEVSCVASHFLDSGSFTLWTRAATYAKESGCGPLDFYDTEEFWSYADSYVRFVKKYRRGIDLYANIDVIPLPSWKKESECEPAAELSWRNQRYLEKKGLNPVPVVHYKTSLRWLQKYIDSGHKLIGLGGLVGSTSQDHCKGWIDRCFDLVCDNRDRLPCVKLHGFGVTSFFLMLNYPWWSTDSTSWTKMGAFGNVLVPHKRKGKFVFPTIEQGTVKNPPYVISVSGLSPNVQHADKHLLTLKKAEREIVEEWLQSIGISIGKLGPEGEVVENGVVSNHIERRAANLLFFEAMRETIPPYPWPFSSKRRKGMIY